MVAAYSEHVELRTAIEMLKKTFEKSTVKNTDDKNISDALGCILTKDITAHTGYSVIITNNAETKDPAIFYQACMEELPTTGTTPVYDAKDNAAIMEYKITKDKKKVILTYKVNNKSATK